MICGGGFISVLQGYLSADSMLGIGLSYVVGIACFIYLAYYALKVTKDLKAQGINLVELSKEKTGGGH